MYCRIEPVADVISFPGLIWNVHWLYNEAGRLAGIALAMAHNTVWHWNWEGNVMRLVAQCQEICILYPSSSS